MTGYGCPPGKRWLDYSFMHAQAGEMLMVRHVVHDPRPIEGGKLLSVVSNDLFGHGLLSPLPPGEGARGASRACLQRLLDVALECHASSFLATHLCCIHQSIWLLCLKGGLVERRSSGPGTWRYLAPDAGGEYVRSRCPRPSPFQGWQGPGAPPGARRAKD